jgi:hypothetical protein
MTSWLLATIVEFTNAAACWGFSFEASWISGDDDKFPEEEKFVCLS